MCIRDSPFPEDLAVSFLEGLDEVLVIEELDPVIETELLKIAGKYHLPVNIKGKLTGEMCIRDRHETVQEINAYPDVHRSNHGSYSLWHGQECRGQWRNE